MLDNIVCDDGGHASHAPYAALLDREQPDNTLDASNSAGRNNMQNRQWTQGLESRHR